MLRFFTNFKWALLGLCSLLCSVAFYFIFTIGGVTSLGGPTLYGKVIWYYSLGAVMLSIIVPSILAAFTTYRTSKSFLKTVGFTVITLLIIISPIVIFQFGSTAKWKLYDWQRDRERKILREDVLSWYTPTTAPVAEVPPDWQEYKWLTSLDQSFKASLYYPGDWTIKNEGLIIFEAEGITVTLSSEDAQGYSIRSDATRIEDANFYSTLEDPYYAFSRNQAILVTYQLGNNTIFRAQENNKSSSLDTKSVLFFKKGDTLYEIRARIISDSKSTHTANIDNVDKLFDLLVIY